MSVLTGAAVLTVSGMLEAGAVEIADGRIARVGQDPAAGGTELGGGILVPGFLDLQVNGGGGVLLNDDPSPDGIAAIAEAHLPFGTTGLLPTLISDDLGKVADVLVATRAAIAVGAPGVLGVHIEGPFLNEAKKGIHDARHFRPLTADAVDLLSTPTGGVTLVTLAPEQAKPGVVAALAARGVRVALGHSGATYDEAVAAERDGLTGYTHLFNAMPPFASRAPGPIGAALEGSAWCGLIADGHHVDWASLRLALRAKRDGRFCLVTDAMPCVGSDADHFMLGDRRIAVSDGACRGPDGTLAGSALTMIGAVRNAVRHLDVGLAEAVRLAATEPAAFLGLSQTLGAITPGRRASLVHLSDDLDVRGVWVDGQCLFAA